MSALARMFLEEGKQISGSDITESEITKSLEKLGAKIFIAQRQENLPADADLVIYTLAIGEDNPELIKAKKLGLPTLTYAEALGEVSRGKFTIAISGTNGKTTTTAMVAKILIDAGFDPTVIVGSLAHFENQDGGEESSNFRAGKSDFLVVEACEYKRSFLNLNPDILVITNIDNDHLDYYKDLSDIQSAFIELAQKIPEDGYLVSDIDNPNIEPVAEAVERNMIDYKDLSLGAVKLTLKVPGEHNVLNTKAALAVAAILEIDTKNAAGSLEEFEGTWRRFEYKGKTKKGALVYDDYAHHPTEIKATLSSAREKFPDKKIIVVFQPHLYSRTKILFKDFSSAFGDASQVILVPIYGAREPEDKSVSLEELAEEISKKGTAAEYVSSLSASAALLQKYGEGDLIITMGAGDVYNLLDEIIH